MQPLSCQRASSCIFLHGCRRLPFAYVQCTCKLCCLSRPPSLAAPLYVPSAAVCAAVLPMLGRRLVSPCARRRARQQRALSHTHLLPVPVTQLGLSKPGRVSLGGRQGRTCRWTCQQSRLCVFVLEFCAHSERASLCALVLPAALLARSFPTRSAQRLSASASASSRSAERRTQHDRQHLHWLFSL